MCRAIINITSLSKLVYNAFMLPNPDEDYFFQKGISKINLNFVWNKGRGLNDSH